MAKKNKKKPRTVRMFLASRTFLVLASGTFVLLLCVTAFYAFSSTDEPRRRIRQEPVITTETDVTVDVVDRDYDPHDLTVPRGAKVTWKFKGNLPHNVVDDRGAFESPTLEKGDEWSLTFDNSGTFYYYCTLHHSMQGTLVVAE